TISVITLIILHNVVQSTTSLAYSTLYFARQNRAFSTLIATLAQKDAVNRYSSHAIGRMM
ncbi:hypothetical protein, partial [Paenibacillus germinis]|uniref:hypothetical protein n=1 Tax=Paenibacillus germinis TaxID=2654979 RepID=UPI001C0F6644